MVSTRLGNGAFVVPRLTFDQRLYGGNGINSQPFQYPDGCYNSILRIIPPLSGCGADKVFFSETRKCYYLGTESVNWQTAYARCLAMGMDLTSIHRDEENLFVVALHQAFGTTEDFWLGLNDIIEEGTFRWTDGTPLNYRNWLASPPQPDNAGGARKLRPKFRSSSDQDQYGTRTKLLGLYAVVAFVGSVVAVFFSTPNPLSGRNQIMLFPRSVTRAAGNVDEALIMTVFAGQFRNTSDLKTRRVQEVVSRLAWSPLHLRSLEGPSKINVFVLRENIVQAFVMASGNVVVFDGILLLCPTNGRLAAVLGHEMTHRMLDHVRERVSTSRLVQTLMTFTHFGTWMLLGSDIHAYLNSVFTELIANYFIHAPLSRRLELEADWYGVIMEGNSCFDPREAEVFWWLMDEVNRNATSSYLFRANEKWATHPSFAQRKAQISDLLATAMIDVYPMDKCGDLPSSDPRDTTTDREAKIIYLHSQGQLSCLPQDSAPPTTTPSWGVINWLLTWFVASNDNSSSSANFHQTLENYPVCNADNRFY
ncbi:unnamed protein product [Cyprideis torosa]|uniref:Metalloendopeptidase OMA1, mitochondrial n=1 Tax=Cyprideis torosa TaxID=163714 RepID=A0A7R8W4B0_9CRUS|nr:unnamed protein product [Cyprideis torosa]CAG0881714.1 unnamed protein product [Cyprideis torosa]